VSDYSSLPDTSGSGFKGKKLGKFKIRQGGIGVENLEAGVPDIGEKKALLWIRGSPDKVDKEGGILQKMIQF